MESEVHINPSSQRFQGEKSVTHKKSGMGNGFILFKEEQDMDQELNEDEGKYLHCKQKFMPSLESYVLIKYKKK